MIRRAGRAGLGAIVLFLASVASAPSAGAHPYLVRAEPAPGSTLATAPKELHLLFTERLDAPYCTVTLVAADGRRTRASVQVTGTGLVATVPDLGTGAYRVEWSVIGDDGHRVDGEYGLAVGRGNSASASTVAGHASGQATTRALRALLVVADLALAAVVLGFVFFRSGDDSPRLSRSIVTRTVWVAALLLALVSVAQVSTEASVVSTVTGRLALQRLLATLALFPVVFPVLRRPAMRRAYAGVAVVVLLVGVALASHALAASTGRTAQVAVLTVHLVAASVWLAAIVAILSGTPARRLAAPVAASIVVVVATGVFNAHVQLGGAGHLLTSAYGRVLDAKVALVAVMIVLGAAAAVWRRWEAAAAVSVLALAGVLGQLPNPVAVPAFSQRHPSPAGSTVATTSTGSTLLAVALTPGRPGLNRLVVTVQRPDANDVPLPVAGVGAVDVAASCACGAPPASGRLVPVDGGPLLAGSVLLAREGQWSLRLSAPDGVATADVAVSGRPNDDEVVVGVPADLSGADADACQDRLLGVQVAASEVNERAVAGGRAVRVVAIDSHGPDPGASVAALRSLGARLLAVPCGRPDAVAAIDRAASQARIPVIGGDSGDGGQWSWPTAAPVAVEGRALAAQVVRQGGRRPVVVVGSGTREQAIAMTAEATVAPAAVVTLADPAATASRIRGADPDVVVFALSAGEAPPLLRALAATDPGWTPLHGAVAASSMMSAVVVTTGGDWFKQGVLSIASEVSPADGSSLDYASRLQQQFPGRHPSVDGVRGYVAGWLTANALHWEPSAAPRGIQDALSRRLRTFTFGPTRLKLDGSGRGAQTMAFFRTVFTNPLALAGLPGQVGHNGVFLGEGTFVQVTPWSTP